MRAVFVNLFASIYCIFRKAFKERPVRTIRGKSSLPVMFVYAPPERQQVDIGTVCIKAQRRVRNTEVVTSTTQPLLQDSERLGQAAQRLSFLIALVVLAAI